MVTRENDPTAHAEIVAIRNACQKQNNFSLSNCAIYTSCEPCPMCLGAIYWAKISKIYYYNTRSEAKNIDFDDEHIYNEIKNDILETRKIPIIKITSDKFKNSFELWKNIENKIEY